MAILGNKNPTLLDVTKATDPGGRMMDIAEILHQDNEILKDMTFMECNDGTSHKSSVRTGLPEGIWRMLYQGVPQDKSERVTVIDATGELSARAEIDKKLADLNGNANAFRAQESDGFIEGMSQQMAGTLMYENGEANPERFMGFAPRYSELNPAKALNARNIIDAQGTGNSNTSVWLVAWAPKNVFGLYPRGMKAGLHTEDLGVIDALDANGDKYRAYGEIFQWDLGLCIKDWRSVCRIANIDSDNLRLNTNAADLVQTMIKATHRIPAIVRNGARMAFYARADVAEALDLQTQDKAQNTIVTGNDVFGNPATMCRGIPIRVVDQLLNTEETVVAS